MGQITEEFTEQVMKEMKAYYYKSLEKAPPGAIFRARINNVVITAYRSGKVLFQGDNNAIEAEKWSHQRKNQIPVKKRTESSSQHDRVYKPSSSLFTSSHIGSDESGTGDYFGPVTACAVYVTETQITELQRMGIQDSKAISDKTVQHLAKELVEMKIPYSLMNLHNEKYNQLQRSGWSQGKMKTMIHHGVIESLLNKMDAAPYEGILVDQFCNPPVYINHLRSEGKTLPEKSYFMTKAENYSIAVAAGSVIARASFLKEMDRLSDEIGFTLLKGASQKVDQLIALIIEAKGRDILSGIAKVHFANTKKAEKYL